MFAQVPSNNGPLIKNKLSNINNYNNHVPMFNKKIPSINTNIDDDLACNETLNTPKMPLTSINNDDDFICNEQLTPVTTKPIQQQQPTITITNTNIYTSPS